MKNKLKNDKMKPKSNLLEIFVDSPRGKIFTLFFNIFLECQRKKTLEIYGKANAREFIVLK